MDNEPIISPPSPARSWVVGRVKRILLSPRTEWMVIENEEISVSHLANHYIFPLAAIPSISLFLGILITAADKGSDWLKTSALLGANLYALNIITLLSLTYLINIISPFFGGKRDLVRSLRLATYSSTPMWVGGISLLVVPIQILVWSIVSFMYGAFILYTGLPRLMQAPVERAASYTATVLAAWLLTYEVAQSLTAAIFSSLR
jgi:hypothetical protein